MHIPKPGLKIYIWVFCGRSRQSDAEQDLDEYSAHLIKTKVRTCFGHYFVVVSLYQCFYAHFLLFAAFRRALSLSLSLSPSIAISRDQQSSCHFKCMCNILEFERLILQFLHSETFYDAWHGFRVKPEKQNSQEAEKRRSREKQLTKKTLYNPKRMPKPETSFTQKNKALLKIIRATRC